ncbi:MAG: ribose 5-phosphate isomerase B [Dehalococcoidaceae bacterium]|nr:ribose 5-phosphate isomerase B [Dehalococcoidaceae bacterium]
MKIAIGSDHRGYKIKQAIIKVFEGSAYELKDFGCLNEQPVDYPDIAELVGKAVAGGGYERGILICGTGIGMCMAANKIDGIRAGMCYDTFCARRARQHNDANVLCLPGDVPTEPVDQIVRVFLETRFEGGRHQRRVDKIMRLEA